MSRLSSESQSSEKVDKLVCNMVLTDQKVDPTESSSNILQEEYNRLQAVAEASSSISSDEDISSDKSTKINIAAVDGEEEKKQGKSHPRSIGTTTSRKSTKKASFALKMRLPTVSVIKNTVDEK